MRAVSSATRRRAKMTSIDKQVLSGVTSVKDASADFLSEFLKDSVHSAVINPYNSLIQLTNSASKAITDHETGLKATDCLKPTEETTGAKAAGKTVGEMAGQVFDFMLMSKLLKSAPGLKSASSAAELRAEADALTARKLTIAGVTGFAQGSLLTPLKDGESNWTRISHGGSAALSFMTIEAVPHAPGLNKLGNGFKAGLVKSSISGAAAGAVQTQADALLSTGRPASALNTLYAGLGGAVGGAAFHTVAKGSERLFSDGKLTTSSEGKSEKSEIAKASPKGLQHGQLELDKQTEEDTGLMKSMQTGKVTQADGTQTKVVVRSLDQKEDSWALMRVQHAQIVRNLHIQEGFSGTPPEITVRQAELNGQNQDVSVQEFSGKSFGGQVRDWAATAQGIDLSTVEAPDLGMIVSGPEIATFIGQHPALKEATAEGFARKLVDGGLDFNLSNWTIPETLNGRAAPDGPIRLYDIDPKRGFASNTVPTYGPETRFGDAPHVVQLFSGKPLSEFSSGLQQKFDSLVATYSQPDGIARMTASGLTNAEAQARFSRLQWIAKNGFPHFLGVGIPEDAPVIFMTPEYEEEALGLDKELMDKRDKLTLDGLKRFLGL